MQAQSATVTLRTGAASYNGTVDCGITTQYLDKYNNYNGVFYPWGSASFLITDSYDNDRTTSFRYLLRFETSGLIPANAVIQSATLTLSFVNWGSAMDVQGCYLAKTWQADFVGPLYSGTGWAFNRYNKASGRSEKWASPGAWQDCNPQGSPILISSVTGSGPAGSTTRTLQLDPKIVKAWISKSTTSNFGMLFRASKGSISVAGSASPDVSSRPLLTVVFAPSSAELTPKLSPPSPRQLKSPPSPKKSPPPRSPPSPPPSPSPTPPLPTPMISSELTSDRLIGAAGSAAWDGLPSSSRSVVRTSRTAFLHKSVGEDLEDGAHGIGYMFQYLSSYDVSMSPGLNGGLFEHDNGNPLGKIAEWRHMVLALAQEGEVRIAIMKFGYADITFASLAGAQAAYLEAVTAIQGQGVQVVHVTPPLVYNSPPENAAEGAMRLWMIATFSDDYIFDLQDIESTDPSTGGRCSRGGSWEICNSVRSTGGCPSRGQGIDAPSGQGHICYSPHAIRISKAFLYAIRGAALDSQGRR